MVVEHAQGHPLKEAPGRGWGAAGLLFRPSSVLECEGGVHQQSEMLDVGEEGGKDCNDDNKQCQAPHHWTTSRREYHLQHMP